jgi:E3 ubiquitin-protein ligase HUWE1
VNEAAAAPTATTTTEVVVVPDPPESITAIRKQSQITMPGEKYRQTERYRNLNIYLQLNETKSDEKLSGDPSNSFQKTLSLRYVQSSGFSVHGTMSSQLPRYQCLISFCHAHKGLLNLLIKSQPHLLDDSLASLVKVVNLRAYLSFENKRKYFFLNLRKIRRDSSRMVGLSLNLRRNKLFEDSFQQMQGRSGVELQSRLRIAFQGEEGIDAGGLTREWFSVLSKEIFNPNYALFTATADGLTFQPNPLSNINSNHLDYFKFVGRVIGKAICDGHLMDAHFTRTFYKHTLGMHCDYHDIEAVEPDYFKSLKQILEFPLDMLGVELTFSAEIHTFGKIKVCLLFYYEKFFFDHVLI